MQQRILLTTLNAKYIHLNLAIRLLYELNCTDERLSFKEFTIKQSTQEIAEECSNYTVVCFSCYIWNITQTLAVCEAIKQINPAIKILLGGPEVTYDWQSIIELSCIDYIITGEGEIPFAAFLQQFPMVDAIPNLVSKKDGQIQYHVQQENFNLELYENTNPYRHDDPSTLINRVLYIETSRGCPYKCEFCLASLDNRVRYLPMEHIKSNLLYLITHGKTIKFLDRTFNVKKDFTIEIFEFILQHAKPHHVFQFEITADILHPAIMQFIKDKVPKGMFRFEIGIQTVNQQANLAVSRKQNFEKTKGVILAMRDYVEMHLDLIVGLPLDYFKDIEYSFEEVFKLHPPELQLGFLKFLKGTPVREKYTEHGYVFDAKAPYQIIRSNYLSEQELHHITLLEHSLEVYWNKKRLPNTLLYVTKQYGAFNFLLALGKYFESKHALSGFTLLQAYDVAWAFIQEHYPQDEILQQLFTVDYYLHHTTKPPIKYIQPLSNTTLLQHIAPNNKKSRYIILPLSFSWHKFKEAQEVALCNEQLCIQFSSNSKPTVIYAGTHSVAQVAVN